MGIKTMITDKKHLSGIPLVDSKEFVKILRKVIKRREVPNRCHLICALMLIHSVFGKQYWGQCSMKYVHISWFKVMKYLNSLNIVVRLFENVKWTTFFSTFPNGFFVPLRLFNRWTYNCYLLNNPFLLRFFI